jgi:hypothetical protein
VQTGKVQAFPAFNPNDFIAETRLQQLPFSPERRCCPTRESVQRRFFACVGEPTLMPPNDKDNNRLDDRARNGRIERSAYFRHRRPSMKMTLREVMCAAALCALAMGVQAQSTDTSKMASPKSDMSAKADADYKAAKQACDAKSGAEKDKCLKDAQMAHEKAMKGSSMSSSKDTSSSGSTPK